MQYVEIKYKNTLHLLYIAEKVTIMKNILKKYRKEFMSSDDIVFLGYGEWKPDTIENQIKIYKAKNNGNIIYV